MIIFNNWQISVTGLIARQYDNLSRRIDVEGDLPAGYTWQLLVQSGGNADTILLEATETGAGALLTADNLSRAGEYYIQLRGVLEADGVTRRHTNVVSAYIPESLTGLGTWPEVPTEFAQVEARILELYQHPPIPGSNGYWLVWDTDKDEYVESQLALPAAAAGGTSDHSKLTNRDAADQHPMSAIIGLEAALDEKQPVGSYLTDKALDATLAVEGKAADAKAVGDALSALSEEIANKAANVYIGPVQPTDGTLYWLDTSESGGSGGETVTYSITAALTNVTIDNTAESANEGESFAAALTVSVGYELSSVKITMGGADITNTAYANGNIYISAVTGDVVITAVAVEVSEVTAYTITNNLVNVTSNNSAVSAEENASYTATLTPATDYALGSVTVTMGGVDITADVYADGVINIPAVTGDVVITATGSYAPTSPVFELAEPYTGTGSESTVLDYNIVDEDKTFSVAIDFSATPTTGIYVFGAGFGNSSLGIRGQGNYFWFAQSQYYKTAEIARNAVTNKKVVLTYEKGSENLLVHHVKTDGTKEIITLAKEWTTGDSACTSLNPNGTINDLKIYLRVLEEAEINEYLGVA